MSVEGLCGICGSAPADRQCDRCGTLVCADHFALTDGVCADCATELKRGRGSEEGDTYQF